MTGRAPAVASPGPLTAAERTEVTAALAAHAAEHDRDGSFPWPGVRAAHDAGLLTASIGRRFGGRGVTAEETVTVFLALGEGDPSVALLVAMTQLQHALQDAADTWPTELYERVLAESQERPVLLNAVRAEPELGAPARGGLPATTAHRVADGWHVVGRKAFATGSEGLAYHLVWVVTDEPEPRVGHVIVPGDADGVEVVRTWDHLGMRASSTHDVIYDVVVPLENLAGAPIGSVRNNPPLTGPLSLAVPALYVGVARAAVAAFVAFARERVPSSLGRPIATLERIQTVAGEAHAQVRSAELTLAALAADIDRDRVRADDLAVAKLLTSRAAIAAVQGIVAAIGNPGLTRALPFERHLRDVLCARPHPPQDDAALLAAGRALLLPAPASAQLSKGPTP